MHPGIPNEASENSVGTENTCRCVTRSDLGSQPSTDRVMSQHDVARSVGMTVATGLLNTADVTAELMGHSEATQRALCLWEAVPGCTAGRYGRTDWCHC